MVFAAIGALAVPDTAFTDSLPAATDSADTLVFVADTTPPSCDIELSAAVHDTNQVILSWETSEHVSEDAESIGVWYDTRDFPPAGTEEGTLGIFGLERSRDTLMEVDEKTRYYFTLAASDSAGNWSGPEKQTRASVLTPDRTPPLPVSGISATAPAESTIVVSWQPSPSKDIDSVVLVHHSERRPRGPHDGAQLRALPSTAVTDTIAGLKAKTCYFLAIFVADSAGNWAAAAPGARDSVCTPDQTPPTPVRQFQLTHVGKDTVKLSWKPSSSADAESVVVVYRTNGRFPSRPDDGKPWARYDTETKSDIIDGLQEKQTYHAAAFVCDSAGNWNADTASARDSMTIPDQTPPHNVTSLSAEALNNSTITLEWKASASTDAESVMVRCRTDRAFPTDTANGTLFSLLPSSATSDTLRDLSEKDWYHIALFVKDSAGLWSPTDSTACDSVFTPDQTPPAPVSGFEALHVDKDTIELSWEPSPSADAESVVVVYRTDGRFPRRYNDGLLWRRYTDEARSGILDTLEEKQTCYAAAFVRDSAGNWSTDTMSARDSVTIPDQTPPGNASLLNAKALNNTTIALEWEASASTDAESVMVRYRTDGAFPADTGSGTLFSLLPSSATSDTLRGLSEKVWHHISLFVKDSAGLWSPADSLARDSVFTPDQTPPASVSEFNAAHVDKDTIELSWEPSSSADAESVVVVYRTDGRFPRRYNDGLLWRRYTTEATSDIVDTLEEKQTCHVAAFVRDSARNWSADTFTARDSITIPDQTPPRNVSAVKAQPVDNSTIALRWTASVSADAESVMVRYRTDGMFPTDTGNGTLASRLPSFANTDTVVGLDEKVMYHLALFVRDSAGLWSAADSSACDSVFTPDRTPPLSVTDFVAVYAGGDSVRLSWTPSSSPDAESTTVRYRADGVCPSGPGNGMLWHTVGAATDSVLVTDLLEKTTYHFAAFIRDSAGHWNTADTTGCDSARIPDLLVPHNLTHLSATALSNSSIALAWRPSASSDADSVMIRYRTDGMFPADTGDGTLWRTVDNRFTTDTLTGLEEKQRYHIGVFVRDRAGYWCAADSAAQDTAYTPDQTEPDNVAEFNAEYLGGDSASFTWAPSPSADAESVIVRYATAGIFPQEANQGAVAGVFDVSRTQTKLHGLTDKRNYHFSAFVKDSAGNWSRSFPAAQDTFTIPDLTPPPGPRELAATALDHETVALAWKRPRARDVESIMIRYRTDGAFPADTGDGTLWGMAGGDATADTLRGLREKVCYSIGAFAGDSAGLWSESSPGARDSAFTPDLVPPENVSDLTLTKFDGRKVAASWQPSPSADAESVMVRFHVERFPSGPEDGTQWERYDLSVTADTLSGLTEKYEYHIGVFVKDSSGNWSPPAPSAQGSVGIADIVPPRNVSGVRAKALGGTKVALSWQPSSSNDVESVIISYRTDRIFPTDTADGTIWDRVPASRTADTISGLAADTWYMFGLFAKDSTGNVAVITGSSCAEVHTPK